MRLHVGGKAVGQALLAASLAVLTAGAVTLVGAPTSAQPAEVQPSGAAVVEIAGHPVAVSEVPTPAEVVSEVGSWFAHGFTLDLQQDGTGTFAVWLGALDGDKIHVRLIPAPGPATVAEVTAVETVGDGALGPDARPGVGGLVTIHFGEDVRTARVEWTAGPDRHSADLCPAEGLDAVAMEALRCGA